MFLQHLPAKGLYLSVAERFDTDDSAGEWRTMPVLLVLRGLPAKGQQLILDLALARSLRLLRLLRVEP